MLLFQKLVPKLPAPDGIDLLKICVSLVLLTTTYCLDEDATRTELSFNEIKSHLLKWFAGIKGFVFGRNVSDYMSMAILEFQVCNCT